MSGWRLMMGGFGDHSGGSGVLLPVPKCQVIGRHCCRLSKWLVRAGALREPPPQQARVLILGRGCARNPFPHIPLAIGLTLHQ